MMLSEDQQYDQKVVEAKQKELSMMEYYVFEEIQKANHHCISITGVATETFKNETQFVKARLVAGDFEDLKNLVKYSLI